MRDSSQKAGKPITHFVSPLKTPPKFHEKTPKRGKKESKENYGGRGKKGREILCPPPLGPLLHPSRPLFFLGLPSPHRRNSFLFCPGFHFCFFCPVSVLLSHCVFFVPGPGEWRSSFPPCSLCEVEVLLHIRLNVRWWNALESRKWEMTLLCLLVLFLIQFAVACWSAHLTVLW